MKTNYLKSLGLITVGIVISQLIMFIYTPICMEDKNCMETYAEDPCLDDPRKVDTTSAKRDIAAYQLWLKYVPKYINIDFKNHCIKYDSILFDPSDSNMIKKYVDYFLKANHRKENDFTHLPFTAAKDKSYYISRHDINQAFETNQNATGINVYVATRGVRDMELSHLETHLYVLPTKKVNCDTLIDYYVEEQYALDLTYPCPKMCAYNGAFSHISLPLE
jgi:hypothetical protein